MIVYVVCRDMPYGIVILGVYKSEGYAELIKYIDGAHTYIIEEVINERP